MQHKRVLLFSLLARTPAQCSPHSARLVCPTSCYIQKKGGGGGSWLFKNPSPPVPSLFWHPTCLWNSKISEASNMWIRSKLSDIQITHIDVKAFLLYISKRVIGFEVTPILKQQRRMPIFSRKDVTWSFEKLSILPHVIFFEAFMCKQWMEMPNAFTCPQSKEEATKVAPRSCKSVHWLAITWVWKGTQNKA